MRRIKKADRKSTKQSTNCHLSNFHVRLLKANENISSIENPVTKWFGKIYSKNILVIVKKMLLTMMAISNIDANVRSTNNSNMNTKKLKETKF